MDSDDNCLVIDETTIADMEVSSTSETPAPKDTCEVDSYNENEAEPASLLVPLAESSTTTLATTTTMALDLSAKKSSRRDSDQGRSKGKDRDKERHREKRRSKDERRKSIASNNSDRYRSFVKKPNIIRFKESMLKERVLNVSLNRMECFLFFSLFHLFFFLKNFN